jgi:ABC-2 type transport system permease protein
LFLALMISNALVFRQLALWTASRIYRPAYSGLCGKLRRRKRPRPVRFDRLFSWAIHPLPTPVRVLILKDLRLFRRDPMQWSQFLIFLGLLVLYFFNIRRFTYHSDYVGWMNMVSFLNLSVVGLLLSTFTTRFVFPMISLEGRRFWILGLLPLRRDMILWSKFLFAAGGSAIPFSTLVLLSDAMLNVSMLVVISHQLTCIVLCVGLSGIAVGLGARLPNLREQSPSRIAAGFGGTLNLVISTLYILIVVLLTALPTHFYLAAQYANGAIVGNEGQSNLQWWVGLWMVLGTAASFLLGAVVTTVPMRIGFRAFRQMEF